MSRNTYAVDNVPTWMQLILSITSFMSLLNAALWTMMRIYHGSSRSLKTAGGHMPNPALTLVHMRDIHQSWYSHLWLFVYSIATQEDGRWPSLDFNMLETFSPAYTHTKLPLSTSWSSMLFYCYAAKSYLSLFVIIVIVFAISCLLLLFNATLQCHHGELYSWVINRDS